MFLVNLFGAVFLLPALAAWLGVERAERRAGSRIGAAGVAVANVRNPTGAADAPVRGAAPAPGEVEPAALEHGNPGR